jgi:hypothetical protein
MRHVKGNKILPSALARAIRLSMCKIIKREVRSIMSVFSVSALRAVKFATTMSSFRLNGQLNISIRSNVKKFSRRDENR